MDRLVLVVDSDRSDWNVNEDDTGEVKGYSREELLSMTESGVVPKEFIY